MKSILFPWELAVDGIIDSQTNYKDLLDYMVKMKIKSGFVSNSSTTYFVLNDKTHNIDDLKRRFDLFIQCGMICGFIDSLWENNLSTIEFYLENGVLRISGDSIPEEICKIIRLIFAVEDEYQQ